VGTFGLTAFGLTSDSMVKLSGRNSAFVSLTPSFSSLPCRWRQLTS